ncbi:MAG: hypothetical protein WC294_08580 [Methanoregula sp.]|jgi:hypothetical protein
MKKQALFSPHLAKQAIFNYSKIVRVAKNGKLQHPFFKQSIFCGFSGKIRQIIAWKITLTDPFGWQISDLLTRTTGL